MESDLELDRRQQQQTDGSLRSEGRRRLRRANLLRGQPRRPPMRLSERRSLQNGFDDSRFAIAGLSVS